MKWIVSKFNGIKKKNSLHSLIFLFFNQIFFIFLSFSNRKTVKILSNFLPFDLANKGIRVSGIWIFMLSYDLHIMTKMIGPDAPLPQLANLYLNIQLKDHSFTWNANVSSDTTDSYLWRHAFFSFVHAKYTTPLSFFDVNSFKIKYTFLYFNLNCLKSLVLSNDNNFSQVSILILYIYIYIYLYLKKDGIVRFKNFLPLLSLPPRTRRQAMAL